VLNGRTAFNLENHWDFKRPTKETIIGVPESWKIVRPIWVTKPVSPENRILVAGKLELLTIIFLVKTPSRPTLDTNQNIE
jgi:hypothetical protein